MSARSWPGKCETKFCRGLTWESGKSPYCSKCRMRRFKAAHPLMYAFLKLKYRAKERGHEFTLSFEEYEKFAVKSGHAERKGKEAGSLSIDRIDERRGYSLDNIRAITLSENSRRRYAPLPDFMRAEVERLERAA